MKRLGCNWLWCDTTTDHYSSVLLDLLESSWMMRGGSCSSRVFFLFFPFRARRSLTAHCTRVTPIVSLDCASASVSSLPFARPPPPPPPLPTLCSGPLVCFLPRRSRPPAMLGSNWKSLIASQQVQVRQSSEQEQQATRRREEGPATAVQRLHKSVVRRLPWDAVRRCQHATECGAIRWNSGTLPALAQHSHVGSC